MKWSCSECPDTASEGEMLQMLELAREHTLLFHSGDLPEKEAATW